MTSGLRCWQAVPVPDDSQDRWMVASDDGLAMGVWFEDEDSATKRADWQNEKEAAYRAMNKPDLSYTLIPAFEVDEGGKGADQNE